MEADRKAGREAGRAAGRRVAGSQRGREAGSLREAVTDSNFYICPEDNNIL